MHGWIPTILLAHDPLSLLVYPMINHTPHGSRQFVNKNLSWLLGDDQLAIIQLQVLTISPLSYIIQYVIISRRHSPVLPSDKLQLYGQTLCKVSLYKHLGALLSSDMKLSQHIDVACSKAKCILGLLYRRFYGLADCKTIIKLYLSVVRPHLEYASSLWDSYTAKDILALENVQKFACKIATKQ